MNLSRKWLNEYTEVSAASKEYEEAMTLAGSKVELTTELSETAKNVVAGRVTEIERHPDSDHLWACQVDVGERGIVQIITGAQNVRAGDMVPAALHKSLLPNGTRIEKGKLRGLKSEGMLCSLSELNLDLHDFPYADTDGIFIMREECRPGDDIKTVIGLDDSVVEFEITNNRSDCLSVIGLARESAAVFKTPLKIPEPVVKGSDGNITELLAVEIRNPELCPRYTARMIKNIKIEPSPKWLRQRLRSAGVRPINNIVDITNYVMLEYGQPMHAFDYACLDGGEIVVRTADAGEKLNTLDGTPRTLTKDMLVIADSKKPVGVAGVMGGENSEITGSTKYAVFESANFNGVSIRKTAMALSMRTDSSGRFEKGLDIENTYPAVQRACELVELLGAGEVVGGVIDIRAAERTPVTLKLDAAKINRLLGTDISEEVMVEILTRLGFLVTGDDVTVPSWRGDVEHYTDLAEEVARFYGYNIIEPTAIKGSVAGGLTKKQSGERKIGELCRAMGFSEICTYSFISPADYDRVALAKDSPLRGGVTILNPLGEDRSVMRSTSLPSMLETLAGNLNSRNADVRLYEIARVYRDIGQTLPEERQIVTLGAYGHFDFFALKGAVEAILGEMRVKNIEFRADTENPSYHTGRCAVISKGGKAIGTLGQVHPVVAKKYGLADTYAAELDLPVIFEMADKEPVYSPLPRFPAITRDLALVCDDKITVAELTECISQSGGALLREVKLFDIYRGDPIPQGKKSAAFSLNLRSEETTLTDAQADEIIGKVLAELEKTLGAVIR